MTLLKTVQTASLWIFLEIAGRARNDKAFQGICHLISSN